MEIAESARKHGITDDEIRHAARYPLFQFDQGDGRIFQVGPTATAKLIELVIVNDLTVIHAMEMRPQYRRFLKRG